MYACMYVYWIHTLAYRWLDQTFDAVVHWHSQIHVWWYFSAKLYATFWRKLAGVLLAFTHQGHFEYSGLQEWGDTKETLHCHLVYSVLWLPCAVLDVSKQFRQPHQEHFTKLRSYAHICGHGFSSTSPWFHSMSWPSSHLVGIWGT